MPPPCFDHYLRLPQRVEDLAVEELITELAVEAFAVAVLPRAPRFDVGGLRTDGGDPVSKRPGNELGAVVGTDVSRHAAQDEEIRKRVDDIRRLERPGHPDRKSLAVESSMMHSIRNAFPSWVRSATKS